MKKHSITLLLAGLIALSSLPAVSASQGEELLIAPSPIAAQTDKSSGMVQEPTTEELEAVIKLLKPKLSVPESCTDFRWDYDVGEAYGDAEWRLTWSNPQGSERVTARCDAKGRLTYYDFYDGESREGKELFPSQPKEAYAERAQAFLTNLVPEAHLYLVDAQDAAGLYDSNYRYTFIRRENGVDFPQHQATVQVNAVTGAVSMARINYEYDAQMIDIQNPIRREQALSLLHEVMPLTLSYTRNRTYQEDGSYSDKAVLVYAPENRDFSVDAMTGEIYTQNTAWVEKGSAGGAYNGAMKEMASATDTAEADYRLTEEELAQLEKLNQLIRKEDAIRRITENTALYLDIRLSVVDARLSRRGGGYAPYRTAPTDGDSYVWELSFSMPADSRSKETYYDYPYAYATVDAQNGTVLQFYSQLHDADYYEQNGLEIPKKQFDEAACEKRLADFARSNTAYFDLTSRTAVSDTNVIYVKQNNQGQIEERIFGAYDYRFTRMNEGLPYPYDYISGTVDGITGKISSFRTQWSENVTFESPSDAISEEEAYALYADFADIKLIYEAYTEYSYGTEEQNSENTLKNFILRIRHQTGDYKAIIEELIPSLDKEAVRNMITAGDMEGLIALAAQALGVDPVDAVDFYYGSSELYNRTVTGRPVYAACEPSVTVGALSGMQVRNNGTPVEPVYTGEFTDLDGHWSQPYVEALARVGVVSRTERFRPEEDITAEEFNNLLNAAGFYRYDVGQRGEKEQTLSRLEAVKTVVSSMGLERAAKITGIYRTEFTDNPLIDEADVGYLAIAFGLGIIEGDAGTATFRPDDIVTRGEAAKLIYTSVLANAE